MRRNQQTLNQPENQLLTEINGRKEFKTYVQDTGSDGQSTKWMIKVAIVLILLNFSLLIFKKTKLQHQDSLREINVLEQNSTFNNIGNLVKNNLQVLEQAKPMPRILWLQTDDQLQVKGMQFHLTMADKISIFRQRTFQLKKSHAKFIKYGQPVKCLNSNNTQAHPDYEYTLWSEDNFTRDNFPQSYDLLKNLLQYDRKIPTIKTSMIADIMRYEIVYMQGGFFVDTNFMFFGDRPLDKFLPYSMVLTGELSPTQKVYKDHSFFSCAQKCQQLARIVSHQSLSGRRKYSINNDKETGRVYFAKITIDNQENIFQPSFEEFYPNLIYDFPVINRNKCIPSGVFDNEQILFNSTRRSYMKNCSKIYSYAYGINFMEEGFTFGASRW